MLVASLATVPFIILSKHVIFSSLEHQKKYWRISNCLNFFLQSTILFGLLSNIRYERVLCMIIPNEIIIVYKYQIWTCHLYVSFSHLVYWVLLSYYEMRSQKSQNGALYIQSHLNQSINNILIHSWSI